MRPHRGIGHRVADVLEDSGPIIMVVAVVAVVAIGFVCDHRTRAAHRAYVAERCGHLQEDAAFMACRDRILAEKGWEDETIPKPTHTTIYSN